MGRARGKMCPKFGRHRRGFKKLSQATLLRDEIYCVGASAGCSLACRMVRRSDATRATKGPWNIGFYQKVHSFLPSFLPSEFSEYIGLVYKCDVSDTRVKYPLRRFLSFFLSCTSITRSLFLSVFALVSMATTFPLPENSQHTARNPVS